MSTIIATVGWPSSGKTTWAQSYVSHPATGGKAVIVSRDDIRANRFGLTKKGVLTHKDEKLVTEIQVDLARQLTLNGFDVIIADTNLRRKTLQGWYDRAKLWGCAWDVVEIATPLDVCLERNRQRPPAEQVPESVILDMAKRFPQKSWPTKAIKDKPIEEIMDLVRITPYVRNQTFERAVIFDVDGTLAGLCDRDVYDGSKAINDPVHEDVRTALYAYHLAGIPIIILTGRYGKYKGVTVAWLEKNDIPFSEIHTRVDGDDRPDWVVKQEIFDTKVAPYYNVIGVYDDRPQVLRMWHDKGLTTFRVGDPCGPDF